MQQLTREQRYSLEVRTASYQSALFEPEGADALDYLVEERGLTLETIRHFRLGLVVDPVESDRPARGNISIPFITPTGVVAIRFRQFPPDGSGPKYWQPEGTRVGVFNTSAIAQGGSSLVICEGEFDCMVAYQLGLPAVGYPGSGSWKPHHKAMYEGFETVYIIGDNDDKDMGNGKRAGSEFAKKVADKVPDPQVRMMPEGHDLTSAFLEHGGEWVLDYLNLKVEDFQ